MNQHALLHEPKTQLGFANPDGSITLRMRTASDDVKKITLIYGDKYIWADRVSIDMTFLCTDGTFDYYEAVVRAPFNRLAYYFEVFGKHHQKWFYTEWGPTETIDETEIDLMFFNFPYVNQEDIHIAPEWIENAIFYQIFPERFENGDKKNDPKNVVPWDSEPTRENFFGGDLLGIANRVDHLADLGINAIYMTPIFESPSNHKYNTTDYLKIDPEFGTLQDFKDLVKKCHDKGIKVVLDAVFNHSGFLFAEFQDVLKKGEKSIYKDWFHIHSYPVTTTPLGYEAFGFEAYMPKLNTGNAGVIEYLSKVARFWIEEADIDGWRLDVANEVDHEFWRIFRKEVRKAKKDAYIVGEIWHNAKPWLLGDQFDGAMNYPFTRACLNYFAYGKTDTESFQKLINATYVRNTTEANIAMLNILDSHDTPRFLTRAGGNVGRLKLAALFQMSFVGAPSVYYGTEIGMEGEQDPDCRRAMNWNKAEWNQDLYEFYKEMINLRKTRSSMTSEKIEWVETHNPHILAYLKHSKLESTLVVMNNCDKKAQGEIKHIVLSESSFITGNSKYKLNKNSVNVEMKAFEYLLFNVKK
jgi:cyclomaltodextrinase